MRKKRFVLISEELIKNSHEICFKYVILAR